jgi:hypothetical protein
MLIYALAGWSECLAQFGAAAFHDCDGTISKSLSSPRDLPRKTSTALEGWCFAVRRPLLLEWDSRCRFFAGLGASGRDQSATASRPWLIADISRLTPDTRASILIHPNGQYRRQALSFSSGAIPKRNLRTFAE